MYVCVVPLITLMGVGHRFIEHYDPWCHSLALGTWKVNSLAGKEPELEQVVERCQLDIVCDLYGQL